MEVSVINNVGLLEMRQGLVFLVPFQIELSKVHVNMSCLDVIRAQGFHAHKHGRFVEIHSFLHLAFWNQHVGHDTIDGDVKWMRRS